MANNQVVLKGQGTRNEDKATVIITPGHLVEIIATGVKPHATAGGAAEKAFAVEDDLVGEDLGDNYAIGDQVQYNVMVPGDEVYALLANGENAAKGSKLESAGDGTLRVVDTDTSAATIVVGSIVAVAKEALDMSGSSLVDPTSNRIAVRIF